MKRASQHRQVLNERRNYFRVKDSVQLRYLVVDQSSALSNHTPSQFNEDMRYSLMRELEDIDQENNKYLHSAIGGNRDLEMYLKSINKKIEIMATTIANSQDVLPDQQNENISLSEGGMSFNSHSELANDSYIALQLTLLPSYVTLVLFGKVINCSVNGSNHKVALSFVNLKDNDRQILAKHIIQVQLSAKRVQNTNKD